ncbi:hypothetical protein [Simiduia agarivorans]|uniref:Transporter n=1 Tax=Simiduia agarivorans (strain DSM 21679 / JCM 13881 / BCRC 17597 / SA1) TaxID=1117647 RepID=K4KJK8_SIMAS|nr:hypothetical protein [Simiduia agarivorans]AFU99339.1 hypothetical protein M5M_10800 [Simiduia agarivorans SA1 = DSM 21679]
MKSFIARRLGVLCIGSLAAMGMAHAQEVSDAEIARKLADPNNSLGVLNFLVDYTSYTGDLPDASNQSSTRLSFQPSFPYKLSDTTNLFVRPLIPVYLDQPYYDPDAPVNSPFSDSGVELGDISFDVAVGRSFSNGVMVVGGLVGTLPTGTKDELTLDQYLLGPEVLVGYLTPKYVVGALFTHQWDVAGSNDRETSISGGQYFYTINLEDAWQIQASPTWSYDHNATSDNALTFPVGVGITKTTRIGSTPWKFGVQYWHYLEQADPFGPDFQIRFSFAPVVPLPW